MFGGVEPDLYIISDSQKDNIDTLKEVFHCINIKEADKRG